MSSGVTLATVTPVWLWGTKDTTIRGHEFHYSEIITDLHDSEWRRAYRLIRSYANSETTAGFQKGNVFASYVHIHFASQPGSTKHFLTKCRGRI